MNKYITICLSLLFFASSVFAYERACEKNKEIELAASIDIDRCICDERLKNVTITLPDPLYLAAICSIYWDNQHPIDLKKEVVSFDGFTNGNYPSGQVIIYGDITLTGIVRFEDNEMGYNQYSFILSENSFGKKIPHIFEYHRMNFDERDSSRLNVTEAMRKNEYLPGPAPYYPCYEAEGKIKFKGMRVILSDSDDQGIFPLGFEVISMTSYKRCMLPES